MKPHLLRGGIRRTEGFKNQLEINKIRSTLIRDAHKISSKNKNKY